MTVAATMKRFIVSRYIIVTLACSIPLAAAAVYFIPPDYRGALAECRSAAGTVILDRGDRLLHVFPDGHGRITLWRGLDDFPESLKRAVIAAEDKRFYYHPGFDPVATVRALGTNMLRGRTVSGASTITQQVVRLISPRPRTYSAKLRELLAAIKMECQISKADILELYLNLAPMSGNIRGAALAALSYFDKDVSRINLPEAAVLAAIPRTPFRYDPRRPKGREQLLKEKDSILKRMADLGWLSPENLGRMTALSVNFRIRSIPKRAPHFVDYVTASVPETGQVVRTTLNRDLQAAVSQMVKSHRSRLAGLGIEQAGVLVASASGEILAMVGSLEYGLQHGGFNNAVLAKRGAGSTLKPFLYALALERGYRAASEIPDTFRSYRTPQGDYLPLNADRRNYGPVSLRSALGNSLNISAVKMARDLGLEDFYELLDRLDLASKSDKGPEPYGLGLAIGNMEVSLYQLVQAYGALARGGQGRRLQSVKGQTPSTVPVFSRETAYVISHVLSDHSARLLTFGNPAWFDFGFPVCVKTGTSNNFRDAWTIAYTPQHVVGIWAGNFNGRPNSGVPGSTACGPILQDIVGRLYQGRSPGNFEKPEGVQEELVCSMSGKRATAKCPHKMKDLVISSRSEPMETCPLPHDAGLHHYLGSAYAQWIDRRETELGPGRFRLMRPDPAPYALNNEQYRLRGHRIEIVNPHEADRFVLSPHRPNRVLFRAVPQPVVDYVTWLMDGVEIARTPPPYELRWDLIRGTHVVHAVTPGNAAARITIHVE